MTSRWMLLFGISGIVAAATPARTADLRPMVVTSLTGTLRVQQSLPCDDADETAPVTGGRFELTPSEGFPVAGGGRHFMLSRANVSFGAFSVSGDCAGFGETRNYSEVQVQLTRAVSFTGLPTGTPNVFSATIPRDGVEVTYGARVGSGFESGTKQPKEDPIVTINLAAGTMQMHVVLGTRVRIRAGCAFGACVIDETHNGTLTADVSGSIVYPDTDGDGVPDRTDNCRFVANPDQSPVATPTIAPPPNVTLASCLERNFGSATGTDVCDGGSVSVTNNAPPVFAVGPNTVTWRAQDAMSRVATATQTVTIVDTTAPNFTFVPLDIHLNDCGPANLGQATAVDDCAGTPTVANNAPPKFFVGSTPVTWTATDLAGNSSTATQTVHVVDTVPPAVSCIAVNPTGNSYVVSAVDSCTSSPALRLGSFTLALGETIMINETGQPGVRLLNVVGPDRIRHFQVGRGEAIVRATDESGNSASAACPVR